MENGLNYVALLHSNMQGGDGLYNRMAAAQLFRESNMDTEMEHKTKKVTEKFSDCLNIIANEPSLAFFRIQEHVQKTVPRLVEQKHEVQDIHQSIQGACFDTEYATNAVKAMHKSQVHFQNIQELIKNAMFMKQQIEYEQERKQQELVCPSMYTASGGRDAGHSPVITSSTDSENSLLQSGNAHVSDDFLATVCPCSPTKKTWKGTSAETTSKNSVSSETIPIPPVKEPDSTS